MYLEKALLVRAFLSGETFLIQVISPGGYLFIANGTRIDNIFFDYLYLTYSYLIYLMSFISKKKHFSIRKNLTINKY